MKIIEKRFRVSYITLFGVLTIFSQANAQKDRNDGAAIRTAAVIPLEYVADVADTKAEGMPYRLQSITVDAIEKFVENVIVQDVAETNSILLKNDVTMDDLKRFTPSELSKLLEVDYVIIGAVLQEYTGSTSHSNSSYYSKRDVQVRHNGLRGRGWGHGTETSDNSIKHKTNVTISIYDSHGKKVFDKSRSSILPNSGSYRSTIRYVFKRLSL